MKRSGSELLFSASDLANHLACKHLTELNRAVAEGRLEAPAWLDPGLALLQERGLDHEQGYIEHLRAQGLRVVELRDMDSGTALERTQAAMREGADVIVQASLRDGRWGGRADVLLRVSEPSDLGDWSYEVVDTKLAQETRGSTVLQLCLYSHLVGRIQGRPPELMHVVKPGEGFPRESFRFADFQAYFRLVQRSLGEAVAEEPSESTYPDPVAQCDICRWWAPCDARRHRDDHLCLVAGLRTLHIGELKRQGIHTLEQFAEEPNPLRERPTRGHTEAFASAQGQAKVQLAGRRAGRLLYELLPAEPNLGLARLPEPAVGDLFFDIESDPFVGEGGLEYLLGVAVAEADGSLQYQAFWGFDQDGERRAFEGFMDFVMDHWQNHPGMHIYHFSPYEPAAVKRVMGRHGTQEAEVDRLLRAGRFVDLLAVTRQGLRASVESYSLKQLERFVEFDRTVDLHAATVALRRIACALELEVPGEITTGDREAVEGYNRDDCLSTAALRQWLEERRAELVDQEGEVVRPEVLDGEASENIEERVAAVQEVFDALVEGLPEDRSVWGTSEQGRWLLAHQLEYFRREDKCTWWEFYRMHELGHEDLLDERKAIAGLEFDTAVGGTVKCPIHRYHFPAQEAAFGLSGQLYEAGAGQVGTVDDIDLVRRTIDIKKRADAAQIHPSAILVLERVNPHPVDSALLAIARSVAECGIDGAGPFRAARDLLLKRGPRLKTAAEGALRGEGEKAVDAAVRLVLDLGCGVLPIQGPPGTGKTHAGARMIVALMRAGKLVGVTAVSHKVIRNLLDETLDAAKEAKVALGAVHKVNALSEDERRGLEEVTSNELARAGLEEGKVLGGTAWLWAREDMAESVDYLFVDEAGQMSLAHVLAVGRAARNLVLLGDPQQLEQPQRGAHPEGAEVAALVHVLDGRKTIAEEAGLFLDVTWRLHPSICGFTSELYYEDRLSARPGLEKQALAGRTPFAGSGLFYVPVAHSGNQSSSIEEIEAVDRIVAALLAPGVKWVDDQGVARRLEESSILVVAPYNAQVSALIDRLPTGVRVGTVDKFQGQQAPVVIYSMASSSAEDAPRGMSFLYNPNRLNVATSRAQCACILVATPQLMGPEGRTPEQMRWANGLCRFRELAQEVVI